MSHARQYVTVSVRVGQAHVRPALRRARHVYDRRQFLWSPTKPLPWQVRIARRKKNRAARAARRHNRR